MGIRWVVGGCHELGRAVKQGEGGREKISVYLLGGGEGAVLNGTT